MGQVSILVLDRGFGRDPTLAQPPLQPGKVRDPKLDLDLETHG
jgi:hypothetical protein